MLKFLMLKFFKKKRKQACFPTLLTALFWVSMIVSQPLFSYEDQYAFSSENQEAQFQQLIDELRCVTCQNQNLADSNAPMAETMRDEIYEKVLTNTPSQEIKDFLVARYGEFVLYRPVLSQHTILLWGGPLILLIIVVFAGIRSFRKQRFQSKPQNQNQKQPAERGASK